MNLLTKRTRICNIYELVLVFTRTSMFLQLLLLFSNRKTTAIYMDIVNIFTS
jgi:hypothetical protein